MCAAAKENDGGGASRAVSVAELDDKSTAKSTTEALASLLYFMACPSWVETPRYFSGCRSAITTPATALETTLLHGRIDGDHRRAGTIRTLACRPNGESIATAISGPRSVYVRRPVQPLQPSVRWPLCNTRTQYLAPDRERKQATLPGSDVNVSNRVSAPIG